MFKWFNYLLLIFGLRLSNDYEYLNKFEIDLSVFDQEEKTDNINYCNIFKLIILYIYRLFIFIILFIKPIYIFYEIFTNKYNYLLTSSMYFLIPIIQYIIAVNYFRKSYFDEIYFDFNNSRKEIATNKKIYKIYLFIFNEAVFTTIILLSTLITVIISGIIRQTNKSSNDINYFINSTYIPLYIYGILNDFYSSGIILLNVFIFFYVFIKHLIDIKKLTKELDNKMSWSRDKEHYKISMICFDIIWLRNELEKSIDILQPIYITNTIFGGIAVGFLLEYNVFTYFNIIATIFWAFTQIMYLYIINEINNQKNTLKKVIKKPKFCIKYLRRSYDINEIKDDIHKITHERKKDFIISSDPNYCTVEYISKKLSQKCKKRKSFILKKNINEEKGKNDIKDIELKIFNKYKIKHKIKIIDDNELVEDIEDGTRHTNSIINEISRQTDIMSNYIKQNSSTIDWIVLNTILNEKWETFEFLGIAFDSSDGIKKAIGITGLIILITKFFIQTNLF